MDPRINNFIHSHHCATICCINESGNPHCFNCYYAFDIEDGVLCFKSSILSKHLVLMHKKSSVAGTILADNDMGFLKRGIQFEGEASGIINSSRNRLSELYYQRYPIAKKMSGDIWLVQLNTIVMSNTSKVFGEKLYWNRNQS